MIEELIDKIYEGIKYYRFKRDLGQYNLALYKHGPGSTIEVSYATWLLKRHEHAMPFIKASRKSYLAEKEEKWNELVGSLKEDEK